jgi:sarcosine oxidase subunit alpha
VLCTEEGILFDDGAGACLGPGRYYLTATTGNAEAVFQWLELWRTTWRLDAVVLNRTSALAAMNLAGPQARAVLRPLTALDLSPAAFPYLALREGDIAGVPCRLMRLGFVGELGYEIHCPAAYAWHLWSALMEAGQPFGIKPFGVEAQRILRLEKGHLIVGQDSDALSNPLDAGLGGLVRFDKPQFHGREPLLRLREMKTPSRLVGFELPSPPAGAEGTSGVQTMEGCQVVEDGRPAGRVTSARYSPTLNKYLGLAWVPVARSMTSERFFVHYNGEDLPAAVAARPFYDPGGERLKA